MKAFLHISDKSYSFDDISKKLIDLPSASEWQISVTSFLERWFSDTTSFEIPTSGSTGRPKLITVSKDDVKRSAEYTINFLGLKQGMSILHCLPLDFVAGKLMLVRSLIGDLNCYMIKPTVNPLLEFNHEVDFIAITPHQLHSILSNPISKERLNKIKVVIIGGSAINENDRKVINTMAPESFLTYGMTETLTHIAMSRLSGKVKSDDFKLIHSDFSIRVNDTGQLMIECPYKHTTMIESNDVVEITGHDSFILKGRVDNVINSGGIKIHPEEVESILSASMTRPFFIAGTANESLGEEATLFVESIDSDKVKKADLEELLGQVKMNHLERPRKVIILPQFVYTDNGKINRIETLKLI